MEEPSVPQPNRPVIQTLQSDLEKAMGTTEAQAVQELLAMAREKEAYEIERALIHKERRWYSAGAFILILLALGAVAFGIYHYRSLTVRVVEPPTVGVFQSIAPVNTQTTDIQTLLTTLAASDNLPEGKPLLVPILDAQGNALSPQATLDFLQVRLSEPFVATLSLVRLGVYNTGTALHPFLIFSTPAPELATKEFLIAEPKLLSLVAPIFGIDLTLVTHDIGTSFQSVYMYNLPVRTLTATNVDTQEKTILLYYGYATDTTVVLATNPTILKSIYDTIIRQR